jgi:hypothetical protein
VAETAAPHDSPGDCAFSPEMHGAHMLPMPCQIARLMTEQPSETACMEDFNEYP